MSVRSVHSGLYHGVQMLRGRPVAPLMRRLERWDALDPAAYRKLADERLAAMLDYARRTVPMYRSGEWGSVASAGRVALADWPVLDRRLLVEHRERLIAEPYANALGRRRLVPRHSSGSTGVPVTVSWNRVAMAWSWAAEYHPMRWHGLKIGMKTLRMWGRSHAIENFVLNRRFVPAHALTPAELERALRFLDLERPELVWGTPSAVAELARYASRHAWGRRLVPFAKIGGEQVYPFQREEIREHLGARVIEAYGSTEVGPIAAECPAGSLHVLGVNVAVEILRGDAPAPVGEFGDVVVTTLVNRAMPLVRCRIGDSARLSPEPCRCALPQPVLMDLRGRSADLLLAVDGTPVHGSALGQALKRYSGKPPLGAVQQILFEQLDQRHWQIHVEFDQDVERTLLDRQVTELLQETFGAGCRAEIKFVPKIAREPSGKYRYYRAHLRTNGGAQPQPH